MNTFIFIYRSGKFSKFIMCLAIPIYFTLKVKKNPLNGWGKGKNIQFDLCFDANSAPRNSILTMVYKGQSSRSKGHRAGVTLQIKWRDLWNLIADKVHLYFTHTTYMIKTFTGAKVGGGGVRVSNFPTSTLGRTLISSIM